jgi:hypothetical protein
MAAVTAASQPQVPAGITQSSPQAGYAPPLSAEKLAKEKERVDLLFEINQILMQEAISLQEQGKGGNVQYPPKAQPEGKDVPSPEYAEYVAGNSNPQTPPSANRTRCLKRLQANLTYIANDAERHHKKLHQIHPGPAVMSPPHILGPELVELYNKLQALFPNWKGRPEEPSPRPQSANPPSASATPT